MWVEQQTEEKEEEKEEKEEKEEDTYLSISYFHSLTKERVRPFQSICQRKQSKFFFLLEKERE